LIKINSNFYQLNLSMTSVTKPTLFLKNSDMKTYVKVSGLNMCFGIFMKHYRGFNYDSVVAGHFNTPEMYNENQNKFTESGKIFFMKYFQNIKVLEWNVEDIEILIYYAEKMEGKTHENTEKIIDCIKMCFKNVLIEHIETCKGKDDEGEYTFVF
jgi:hypothetical protein